MMTAIALTTRKLRERKKNQQKIVMSTAYDATFAALLERAGVDILLVGDSLGMVIQGHQNTLPVTVDHMVYHLQAVNRGCNKTHIVGDLPFMSYHISQQQALENATRLMQQGGAHAIKLEGGSDIAPTVRAIVQAGIPVMGHIGLTPQSVHAMGGFCVQGRTNQQAQQLVQSALDLQQAGCYSIVLEGIPALLAELITEQLSIPTIGIGAGPHCDGQVLVCYDLLGMNPDFKPKFVKQYAALHESIVNAAQQFVAEVRCKEFPTSQHSFDSNKLDLDSIDTNPSHSETLHPKIPQYMAELT